MAEEKPRAPRARKKASETETVIKATPKKKPATTAARRRKVTQITAVPAEPEYVAVRAYYLWEQGEPGDPTEHWLRAEQELAEA